MSFTKASKHATRYELNERLKVANVCADVL